MATKAPPPWCSFTKPLRCMDAPVAIEFASLKKKRLQCCKLALAAVHSFAKLCTQIESCNWALWRAEWRAVCIPHTKLGALARGMARCVYSPHKIGRSGAECRAVCIPHTKFGALARCRAVCIPHRKFGALARCRAPLARPGARRHRDWKNAKLGFIFFFWAQIFFLKAKTKNIRP